MKTVNTINISSRLVVDEEQAVVNGKVVIEDRSIATFNGNITEQSPLGDTTMYIQNATNYEANKKEVAEYYAEFKKEVEALANRGKWNSCL